MKVPIVLVDGVGRQLEVEASIDVKVIGVAAPGAFGAFIFERTDETTATGRRIYRQLGAPRFQKPCDTLTPAEGTVIDAIN